MKKKVLMKTVSDIFIVDGARTPVATPFKNFKFLTAAQLGAPVIAGLIDRTAIRPEDIDEVILGNTVGAGTGQNFARQAGFIAGLPLSVPCYTVNHVCASGLQALILASRAIRSGECDCCIAGAAESASRTPYLISKQDEKFDLESKSPIDSQVYDGLWDVLSGHHMGELCEALAGKEHISRAEQDGYALNSHRLAVAARDGGLFVDEIIPVSPSGGAEVSRDDHPRRNVSPESFSILRPAFTAKGTVTAGNASVPCDGAAAVICASERYVRRRQLTPMARVMGYASVGVDPKRTFYSAVDAVKACLKAAGLKKGDVDLFEINEAFAAQAIYARRKLRLPEHKTNIRGGDLAIGHPLGAAGARVLVTLMHALAHDEKDIGLAAVCLGGGGAVAVAIENLKGKNYGTAI